MQADADLQLIFSYKVHVVWGLFADRAQQPGRRDSWLSWVCRQTQASGKCKTLVSVAKQLTQGAEHSPASVDGLDLAVPREGLRVGRQAGGVPAVVAWELAVQVPESMYVYNYSHRVQSCSFSCSIGSRQIHCESAVADTHGGGSVNSPSLCCRKSRDQLVQEGEQV